MYCCWYKTRYRVQGSGYRLPFHVLLPFYLNPSLCLGRTLAEFRFGVQGLAAGNAMCLLRCTRSMES